MAFFSCQSKQNIEPQKLVVRWAGGRGAKWSGVDQPSASCADADGVACCRLCCCGAITTIFAAFGIYLFIFVFFRFISLRKAASKLRHSHNCKITATARVFPTLRSQIAPFSSGCASGALPLVPIQSTPLACSTPAPVLGQQLLHRDFMAQQFTQHFSLTLPLAPPCVCYLKGEPPVLASIRSVPPTSVRGPWCSQ